MDIRKETRLRIEFDRGTDVDITVVHEGVMIESKVFNKDQSEIEEVIDYINYNENSNYEVYL
tara:strand:+ start:661 stop:846 length:186 start_codon:yes stop_codon:yes gene_type:complete